MNDNYNGNVQVKRDGVVQPWTNNEVGEYAKCMYDPAYFAKTYFLQPGTKALNKGSLEFSNNSRIVAAATSGSSIRGMSVNLLYLDEFAFVERAADFYTSTYPVVSSGKDTQIIITSTANGIGNMFHKIWEGAMQGVSEFKPFRVDWWDVPGRDEEWKEKTIANTSQLQFDQEFGNTFFGTGDTLISPQVLLSQKARRWRLSDIR